MKERDAQLLIHEYYEAVLRKQAEPRGHSDAGMSQLYNKLLAALTADQPKKAVVLTREELYSLVSCLGSNLAYSKFVKAWGDIEASHERLRYLLRYMRESYGLSLTHMGQEMIDEIIAATPAKDFDDDPA